MVYGTIVLQYIVLGVYMYGLCIDAGRRFWSTWYSTGAPVLRPETGRSTSSIQSGILEMIKDGQPKDSKPSYDAMKIRSFY
jgi:hypothetical protein